VLITSSIYPSFTCLRQPMTVLMFSSHWSSKTFRWFKACCSLALSEVVRLRERDRSLTCDLIKSSVKTVRNITGTNHYSQETLQSFILSHYFASLSSTSPVIHSQNVFPLNLPTFSNNLLTICFLPSTTKFCSSSPFPCLRPSIFSHYLLTLRYSLNDKKSQFRDKGYV